MKRTALIVFLQNLDREEKTDALKRQHMGPNARHPDATDADVDAQRARNAEYVSARRASKGPQANYHGFRQWPPPNGWKYYKFTLPNGSVVEHDKLALQEKHPELLKLIPKEDLQDALGKANKPKKARYPTPRSQKPKTKYTDADDIMNAVGSKGPQGV